MSPIDTQQTPPKNFLIFDPFLNCYQIGRAKDMNKKHGIYKPRKAASPPSNDLALMVPM